MSFTDRSDRVESKEKEVLSYMQVNRENITDRRDISLLRPL